MEEYSQMLYRTAFLHLKNETLALDVVSETVVKGYENIHKLREPAYFKTWLTRILLNTVTDCYRRNQKLVSLDGLLHDADGTGCDAPWVCGPKDGEEVPGSDAVLARMDLAEALTHLPDRQKSVIILKYYEDMKVSEIASVLGLPEGTVKAYLHKGRERLRELLKEGYLYA